MEGYQPTSENSGKPLMPPPKNPLQRPVRSRIRAKVGDHVLATKYSDGQAGDNWVVGVVKEIVDDKGYTWCRVWTEAIPNDVRRFRRAIRIKSEEEAVYMIQTGQMLGSFNPSKSLYSVLGEYRKKNNNPHIQMSDLKNKHFKFPPLVDTRLSELAKMHHTNQTQMLIRLIMEAKK